MLRERCMTCSMTCSTRDELAHHYQGQSAFQSSRVSANSDVRQFMLETQD
jgi:hypothetical protein